MSAEQFEEVLRALVLLSFLSGVAGAIFWGLVEQLGSYVFRLIERRIAPVPECGPNGCYCAETCEWLDPKGANRG